MPQVSLYWTRLGLPISIAVAFLIVATLAITTFRNTVDLRHGEREVSRSYAIKEAIHRMLSSLKDMQTGERGYLITGRPVFLEPFERGKVAFEQSWLDLRKLMTPQEIAKGKIETLKQLADKKISYLDAAIELRKKRPNDRIDDEIIALVRSEEGERLMEAVRERAHVILDEQASQLQSNETRSRQISNTSYRAIVLGNSIALAVIMLSGAISYLDRRRRDESESSLAAKESEISAIFNSASDAILTFDDSLQIRLMNPSARSLLGITAIASSHQMLNELISGCDPSGKSIQELVTSSCQAFAFRGQGKHTNGRLFPVSGRFAKVDSDGKCYNVLLFQDITEIQNAESRRRELAAILDQVSDAIVVCDREGSIVSWSRGASALHAVDSEKAIGQSAKDLMFGTSPHTWDEGTLQIQNRNTFSTVFEMLGPDKQKLWIEHRRSLIRDASGATIGQLVMHIDITERKQEEAKQRRSQRLESIGTLAGGVAHDLNNILTPILMNAKLAQRTSANQARLLEMIVTSAERGGRMVQKLLAFAGGERAALEIVDIRHVVDEVRELLSPSLPKTISLQTKFGSDLAHVQADPTELSQVLVNLVINARDAMPEGGQIELTAYRLQSSLATRQHSPQLAHANYVVLQVKDQGHGIPQEIQERIFDPFFTTKAQGKGTGLGLATSLGIVRSYGGDITLNSEVHQGATFTVYLPIADIQDSQALLPAEPFALPLGNGETILMVDDEVNILESAKTLLEESKYRVLLATSGSEAISLVLQSSRRDANNTIDMVLLDMMMPVLNGIETMRQLRQIAPKLPIIGSSGLRRPHLDPELSGLDGFLTKPYTNHDLLQIVRRTLDANTNKELPHATPRD